MLYGHCKILLCCEREKGRASSYMAVMLMKSHFLLVPFRKHVRHKIVQLLCGPLGDTFLILGSK